MTIDRRHIIGTQMSERTSQMQAFRSHDSYLFIYGTYFHVGVYWMTNAVYIRDNVQLFTHIPIQFNVEIL